MTHRVTHIRPVIAEVLSDLKQPLDGSVGARRCIHSEKDCGTFAARAPDKIEDALGVLILAPFATLTISERPQNFLPKLALGVSPSVRRILRCRRVNLEPR